jgi:dTDP-glucose 4,6-dehydratase
METVLVAGGAGFIGSHMIDRLLERGDRVVCIDDLSTGVLEHVECHAGNAAFRFVLMDVTDRAIQAVLADERFDRVINLASPASPPAFLAHPIETLDVGSIGTRALLEIARRDSARFFLASTSEVYGDPLVHPQPESYWGNVNSVGDRSVYDEAKRFAEALTMAYARTYGVEVRIARIFNTYGPRMQADDGRVVTNLINQALDGLPLTLYGAGSQTRSFCYVDDEVRGLLALLDGDIAGPVNIGNPHEVTVRQLAHFVLELTGSTSTIEYRSLPSDDPQLRCPDIELARRALNWEPTVTLRDGLTRTIKHYESQRRTSAQTASEPSR